MRLFKRKRSCDTQLYNCGWNDALQRVKENVVEMSSGKKAKKEAEESMSLLISMLKRV